MQVKSKFPHPILNTPSFKEVYGGNSGSQLKICNKGHNRALEAFAHKGSFFEVIEIIKKNGFDIYRVKTKYYASSSLYIDSRFVEICNQVVVHKLVFPSKEIIIKKLKNAIGLPYLWGGNILKGQDDWFNFYQPTETIKKDLFNKWRGYGVDCSGLIHAASSIELENRIYPTIPRNTCNMIGDDFGKIVDVDNLSVDSILEKLQPLDLILYKGHVIISLDEKNVIESSESKGVYITNSYDRLFSLIKQDKIPSNQILKNDSFFVVKRWHKKC